MTDETTRNASGTGPGCACGGTAPGDRTTEPEAGADPGAGGLLSPPVLEAELPAELATALGEFLGRAPVATLGEWAGACRRRTAGDGVSVGDLCHADGPTGHRGTLDGERYDFACFYDAVVLAALADAPVDVRTESPGGAVIEARADGDGGLAVDPGSAVFAFGVAPDPPGDGDPDIADVYAVVCPYVRAFPDAAAYRRWAAGTDGPTVAAQLSDATALAGALVE